MGKKNDFDSHNLKNCFNYLGFLLSGPQMTTPVGLRGTSLLLHLFLLRAFLPMMYHVLPATRSLKVYFINTRNIVISSRSKNSSL